MTKNEGTKHDSGKPDLSLLSRELLEAVAKVRMFGAKKYSRDNWKQGFKYSRSVAAAMRHISAMLSGEVNDPESGEPHAAHAICCLEHLLYDLKHHPENDDMGLITSTPPESSLPPSPEAPETSILIAAREGLFNAYKAYKQESVSRAKTKLIYRGPEDGFVKDSDQEVDTE